MEEPNNQLQHLRTKSALVVLIIGLGFPTLITYVYFELLHQSESWVQQLAYGVGKFLQFALPIAWVTWQERDRLPFIGINAREANQKLGAEPSDMLSRRACLAIGAAFGLLAVGLLIAIYFLFLAPTEAGQRLAGLVEEKTVSMGIDNLAAYIALGCFYALVHSFLEEYYWRWFVYPLAKRFVPATVANLISSLGFAAHHVLLLGFFLQWDPVWTTLGSFGVGIGGVFWAWLYERRRSLLSPWLSHLIVDAGIFALGFWLIRALLLG